MQKKTKIPGENTAYLQVNGTFRTYIEQGSSSYSVH